MKDLDNAGVPNTIFAGDMNWNEKDGDFPLPDGWYAFVLAKPSLLPAPKGSCICLGKSNPLRNKRQKDIVIPEFF